MVAIAPQTDGRILIGKLVKIASQSGKLPKDLLKKLQGLGNQTKEPPAAKAGNSPKSNADSAAPKTAADHSSAN